MAYEESLVSITLPAAADLSAKQYNVVWMTSTGVDTAAAAEVPIGVLQNKPTAGQAATVAIAGVTKVVQSAAVAVGAQVGVAGTEGQIDDAGTTYLIGVALTDGGAANAYADVLLTGNEKTT